jgi:hypothetical protein
VRGIFVPGQTLQSSAMFDAYLVPEKTVVDAKGDSSPVDVTAAQGRTLLLLLTISNVIEQESLDVSVWGSADGNEWGSKPIASFPQKFYPGEHPTLLDLAANPDIRHLRAHWEVNRWGRGSETPTFEFSLRATEVTPEMLRPTREQ